MARRRAGGVAGRTGYNNQALWGETRDIRGAQPRRAHATWPKAGIHARLLRPPACFTSPQRAGDGGDDAHDPFADPHGGGGGAANGGLGGLAADGADGMNLLADGDEEADGRAEDDEEDEEDEVGGGGGRGEGVCSCGRPGVFAG